MSQDCTLNPLQGFYIHRSVGDEAINFTVGNHNNFTLSLMKFHVYFSPQIVRYMGRLVCQGDNKFDVVIDDITSDIPFTKEKSVLLQQLNSQKAIKIRYVSDYNSQTKILSHPILTFYDKDYQLTYQR
jgi:hypothetical protein